MQQVLRKQTILTTKKNFYLSLHRTTTQMTRLSKNLVKNKAKQNASWSTQLLLCWYRDLSLPLKEGTGTDSREAIYHEQAHSVSPLIGKQSSRR